MNENKSRAEIAELLCDVESLRDRAAAMENEHRKEVEEIAKSHGFREEELTEYSQQLIENFEVLKKEVGGVCGFDSLVLCILSRSFHPLVNLTCAPPWQNFVKSTQRVSSGS